MDGDIQESKNFVNCALQVFEEFPDMLQWSNLTVPATSVNNGSFPSIMVIPLQLPWMYCLVSRKNLMCNVVKCIGKTIGWPEKKITYRSSPSINQIMKFWNFVHVIIEEYEVLVHKNPWFLWTFVHVLSQLNTVYWNFVFMTSFTVVSAHMCWYLCGDSNQLLIVGPSLSLCITLLNLFNTSLWDFKVLDTGLFFSPDWN